MSDMMSAPAPPTTDDLLHYAQWLSMELRLLARELEPTLGYDFDRCRLYPTGTNEFHFPPNRDWRSVPPPSTRAASVMSAVGFDWRREAENGAKGSDIE